MNNHWLVLTDHGWTAFPTRELATERHCQNIRRDLTSYLTQGSTKDASGAALDYTLIEDLGAESDYACGYRYGYAHGADDGLSRAQCKPGLGDMGG